MSKSNLARVAAGTKAARQLLARNGRAVLHVEQSPAILRHNEAIDAANLERKRRKALARRS